MTRAGRAKALLYTIEKLDRIEAERAAAPEHQNIPGGKTGLVVIKGTKVIRDADGKAQSVIIVAEDTKHISMKLVVFEHIARELGQWVEKAETKQVRKLDDLSDEELQELIRDAEVVQARIDAEAAAERDGKTPETVH